MNITAQIAKNLRDFYTGNNWTAVNLKNTLNGVTWQQAVTKVHDLNTIAALVFHINYYVGAALNVLQGQKLNASDKFSFDLPPITNEDEWQKFLVRIFAEAELFADQIEALDEKKLFENFDDPKYGNYYRNITGIIEHGHYHLGQIVLLKKIIAHSKL